MFDEEYIKKLQKYRVPYHETENSIGFPIPAYRHNEKLRWVYHKCPTLYYKITGECRKRPLGYRERDRKRVKKQYTIVWEQHLYADFWGQPFAGMKFERIEGIERKPVVNNNVELTKDDYAKLLIYEKTYVDYIMIPTFTKVNKRRLAV